MTALAAVSLADLREVEVKFNIVTREEREIREMIARLDAAGHEGPCPVCDAALGWQRLGKVLALLECELNTLAIDREYFRQRREQIEASAYLDDQSLPF